jgi:hypothetical protein
MDSLGTRQSEFEDGNLESAKRLECTIDADRNTASMVETGSYIIRVFLGQAPLARLRGRGGRADAITQRNHPLAGDRS